MGLFSPEKVFTPKGTVR